MEVSRLGVELELRLLAYATATVTATWDLSCICSIHDSSQQYKGWVNYTWLLLLSCICSIHHSSQQYWILNPLSGARDRIYLLMDTSWFRYH